jgi:cytochrome c556
MIKTRNRIAMGESCMKIYWTAIAMLLCVSGGCSRSAPPPPSAPEVAPTATIKDLMDAMVDPSAEFLFDNIVEIVDEKGIIDKTPKTDDEWKEVRRRALMLVEAPNLLVMPGRKVAKPGEKAEYPEVELVPEQIQKLIDDDRDAFVRRARRLQDTAALALKAIDARDKKELFSRLGDVDKACESCHLHYWYPNDKRAQAAAREEGVD